MSTTVRCSPPEVHFGEPLTFGGISLFPLYTKSSPKQDYILLEDALEMGLVALTDTGRINRIKVENRCDRHVLILGGTQLSGGLQNRIVNATVLVGAGQTLVLSASCVERMRWSPRVDHSAGCLPEHRCWGSRGPIGGLALKASIPAPPSVRGQALADTHWAQRTYGRPETDQVAIWYQVSRLLASRRVYSRTEALDDVYAREGETLDRYVACLPYPDGAVGAVVGGGKSVRWIEMLSRPEAARAMWGRWVRSWALEYGGRLGSFTCSREQVDDSLERLFKAAVEAFKGQGLGWELRYSTDGLLGYAYAYRREILHLVAAVDG